MGREKDRGGEWEREWERERQKGQLFELEEESGCIIGCNEVPNNSPFLIPLFITMLVWAPCS